MINLMVKGSTNNGMLPQPQKYKAYAKSVALITIGICLALFAVIFLIAGFDYRSVVKPESISEVSGVVERVEFSEEYDISIYFENNKEEYYLPCDLYELMDFNIFNRLRIGDSLDLTVGRSFSDTYYVIGMVKEGLTYIPIDLGHEHYAGDSVAMLALGVILTAVSVILFVIGAKKRKKTTRGDFKTELFADIAEEGDTVLWHKALTAKDMVAMTFAPLAVIFLIIAAIGVILFLAADIEVLTFVIFFGVTALLSFGILCITFASSHNRQIYVVTDKRIVIASPVTLLYLNYESIKDIKIKNALFFGGKSNLHFIPTFKASVAYRFNLLDDGENVKRLIDTRMRMAKTESEF